MSGESCAKEFHLIGEHIVIREIQKLVLIWHEGDGQQLHIGLLRSAIGLSIIATPAGSNDIGPDIYAPLGQGLHMITRQFVQGKLTSTVEADILVPSIEKFVFQRRVKAVVVNLAIASNDAWQAQYRLLPAAIDATAHLEDCTTQ